MNTPGIGSWLVKRELISPEKEAVVDGNKRLTYKMLNRRVNKLSNALQYLSVKYGDRICILSYNSSEYIETIMATAKLGVMIVPLNWRLTPIELAFAINDSGSKFILIDPEFEYLIPELKKRTPLECYISIDSKHISDNFNYEILLEKQDDSEPVPEKVPDLNSKHIIMYTSGTTGLPKGAVLTQASSFWNSINLNHSIEFSEKDRNLVVLPMFHIGGIGLFTLPVLYFGGTVVIQKTFDPKVSLDLITKENISLFFGVPAMFLGIIQHVAFDPEIFNKVRVTMSGGAPLPHSLIKSYNENNIILRQGFGMSEAGPTITTLDKNLSIKKAGSVGRAVFHLDAKIVNNNMNEISDNTIGELVLKGPNLFTEYWNRPDATSDAFSGEWFHTGDLARMDEDGDIYIVERKKDMYISGGENVYPAEVENAIYEINEVAETAVIGVNDEKWGESGLAAIVLKNGVSITEDNISAYLNNRIARFKIPKKIVFVEELPRNASGKVLKNLLREVFN